MYQNQYYYVRKDKARYKIFMIIKQTLVSKFDVFYKFLD